MQRTKQWYQWILEGSLLIIVGLFITGCSSGGSSSGAGSSVVEGNVVSFSVAMQQPIDTPGFSLAAMVQYLLPFQSAYAATQVENIQVDMVNMTSTTDGNGHFSFSGVSTGTYQIRFTKNGQSAGTSVEVRENDRVIMTNVRISGHQVHMDSITHQGQHMPGGNR
jgi:hypothetical protein